MSDLVRTALAIDQKLLKKFDSWMEHHNYDNRSEAVRDLIRSKLVEQEWDDPAAEVIATLSIIFDHDERSLAQDLTRLQHEDHHAIICSQHVHLSHQDCLEVILLRGPVARVRKLADAIISTRGVKAGELTLLSTEV